MSDNEKKEFLFSVLMSVYQVEDYIEEAIDSLINQTIGFDSIQLILVDDGSTDNSGVICDTYQKKYSSNVIVIHKENGGLSSARNAGLKYVQGKYVSFLDADDILDLNVFEKVRDFMDEHYDEVDMCSIPYFMFGAKIGPHPLNYKYDKGTRVINLLNDEDANCIQLSAATSFYKAEIAKKMVFDTELVTAEDAKENLRILLSKPYLGVVSDVKYHYRKHGSSILDKSQLNKGWYSPYLQLFSNWALDVAQKMYGYVPKFVQYTVMYDLQWKIRKKQIQEGALTPEEAEEYQKLLIDTVCKIDDDVIINQKSLKKEHVLYLLYIKDPVHFFEKYMNRMERFYPHINFIYFQKNSLIIEGSQRYIIPTGAMPNVYVNVDGKKEISAVSIDFVSRDYIAGIETINDYKFRVKIDLELVNNQTTSITFGHYYNDIKINSKKIITKKFTPITNILSKSYFFDGEYLLTPSDNGLKVTKVGNTHKLLSIKKELLFMAQLLKKHNIPATKAVILRLLYFIMKPLVPTDIWLITDKANRADDNGEAFFKYLMSHIDEVSCHPIFALSKHSLDYERLKRIGKVIPYMSWRHKIVHLLAKHTISAYSFDELSSPFLNRSYYYGDLLQHNKIVFLQHGIIKDDLSKQLNRFHKNYSIFVTSAQREYQSVVEGNYAYDNNQVVLSGLPRYDYLYNNPKKYITVMPTWDAELVGRNNPLTGIRELKPGFEESEYYLFYTSLLSNDKLLSTAEEKGYIFRFFIHPVLIPYVDRFKFDTRVQILHPDVSYKDIFADSSLITTDYSSVFFDFAYLRKPVVYTQFRENHYQKGYFDYESDGFGEVTRTVDETVNVLVEYIQSDCKIKEIYRKRVDSFFSYNDRNNCRRIYEIIKEKDNKEELDHQI